MNLADLIWQWPCWSPRTCTDTSESGRRSWAKVANKTLEQIGKAVVIVADNVCEYFFVESDDDAGGYKTFPCCAPPFPLFFVEMRRPSAILLADGSKCSARHLPQQWGWLCMAEKHPDNPFHQEGDAEWSDGWLCHMVLVTAWPGKIILPVARIVLPINGDGSIPSEPELAIYGDAEDASDPEGLFVQAVFSMHAPVMLALGFMNCKNVQVVEREPQPRSANSHAKRPPVRYRTITINPLQKSKRGESAGGPTSMKKGLHVCRGHFASYTEKGLFGKHFGQFWIPNHVRGSAEHGRVETTYKVNPGNHP